MCMMCECVCTCLGSRFSAYCCPYDTITLSSSSVVVVFHNSLRVFLKPAQPTQHKRFVLSLILLVSYLWM
eukprot:m.6661 g.6661  ORF g.6661 m.6661 type:complete len:70 (-) comp6223_c0_seq1:170-379(-)